MALTNLDKPLGDLRREILDIQKTKFTRDYDINKLMFIMNNSKESLGETKIFQQQILQQLQQFEITLADLNQILRTNIEEQRQLEQQQQEQSGNDLEIRAKLMALNAEALECRAAAVQLQQEAQIALAKAAEIEKRANDELIQQTLEMKMKQDEIDRNRAAELERRVQLEEERQRLKELQIQQQQQQQQQQRQQERLLSIAKTQQHEDEYANWAAHDFMHDDQSPQCIIRTAPNQHIEPINITYLKISDTENLLDHHEELISTPLDVKFPSMMNNDDYLLLAIPYIVKRSTHRENIIKIRQTNGIWISIESNESTFDSYKDKRFVECQLNQSTSCAVVSRLKRDTIYINRQKSGRFTSSADPRFTFQWPKNVCDKDIQLKLRLQPVDLPTFTQFTQNFSYECQGLLAVGPIIDLHFDDVTFLQSIQLTIPILIPTKKKDLTLKATPIESSTPSTPIVNSQASQQEKILQQQQSIFKSMLGEDSNNERLVLLYCNSNENTWSIDSNINLIDSKTHDIITMNTKYFHSRMIIARCEKQILSNKQLPIMITSLEQSLHKRSVSFLLRHRLNNSNEICFTCCSTQRLETIDRELEQENFLSDNEQSKELILQEGQLLELRFRGNVLPIDDQNQTHPFAFNTYFPFYFQGNVIEIDRYAQHFSPFFYGFIQIFSKQKVLRTIPKEVEKKKQQQQQQQIEPIKQEWHEMDVCLAELVIRLPKPSEPIRTPTPKLLPTFTGEGILTPALFRDISNSLLGDEWRWLARRLGLTRIRIESIERDHPEDTSYYMLLAWFKRVPRSTDKVALLIQGLVNINRWDLAQDLQNIKDEKRQEIKTYSLDDQLKIFRISFNRICQREECVRIWKQLARELLLTNEDIEYIEKQYSSRQERCLRSLETWAQNDGRPDINVLIRTIRSLGFKTLAREITNMT